MAKNKTKTKKLPTSGEVDLASFCKQLTPERATETYYDDDFDAEPPDPLNYKTPPRATRVKAEHLWSLIALALEGTQQHTEGEFEGREDEVLESHIRRLKSYLETNSFVSLLQRDPQAAAYLYWEAVADQPYLIDEHGGIDFGVDEEEWDDLAE